MKQRNFSLILALMLTVLLLNPAVCSGDSGTWLAELVDSSGIVGTVSSMALDAAGNPHIAYRDVTNEDLKYAYHDGMTWYIQTVHSSDITGTDLSLAVDANGHPHIAWTYYTPSYSLMYGYYDGSTWHIENISPGSWPTPISLAVDSNLHPHITYFTDVDSGSTPDSLMYAWHDGASWHFEAIEVSVAHANTRIFSSLKLDSLDRPHVAYSSGFDRHVRYAWKDGGSWQIETVYDDGQMYGTISLDLDSLESPHILHNDFTRETVDYFWKDGGLWNRQPVGSAPPSYVSLVVSSKDVPHISYSTNDGTNAKVQYAYRAGSEWHVESAAWGSLGSLALDATDRAYISYYEPVEQDLWYTRLATTLLADPDAVELYPGDTLSIDLNIRNAHNLYAAQAQCGVDPAVLELQSAVFGDFFDPVNRIVAANEVSPTLGTWFGAISQQNPAGPLSGDGLYATLTLEATGVGTTTIVCDPLFSDRDGFTQTVSYAPTTITVLPYATITGTVLYQGRLDHAGIDIIATGSITQTDTTDNSGDFVLGQLRAGTYAVKADAGSYLPRCMTATLAAGDTVGLSTTQLLGGDLNDDETINIGDATLLTANFGEPVPPADARADINADGVVNVQDLAILSGNYERSGCQGW